MLHMPLAAFGECGLGLSAGTGAGECRPGSRCLFQFLVDLSERPLRQFVSGWDLGFAQMKCGTLLDGFVVWEGQS